MKTIECTAADRAFPNGDPMPITLRREAIQFITPWLHNEDECTFVALEGDVESFILVKETYSQMRAELNRD